MLKKYFMPVLSSQIPSLEGFSFTQQSAWPRRAFMCPLLSGMTKRFYETEHVFVGAPERAIACNAWLLIVFGKRLSGYACSESLATL
jgi:hypothetical protein